MGIRDVQKDPNAPDPRLADLARAEEKDRERRLSEKLDRKSQYTRKTRRVP